MHICIYLYILYFYASLAYLSFRDYKQKHTHKINFVNHVFIAQSIVMVKLKF